MFAWGFLLPAAPRSEETFYHGKLIILRLSLHEIST